jgi:hypothetical protein
MRRSSKLLPLALVPALGFAVPGCTNANACPTGKHHFTCSLSASLKPACMPVCADAGGLPTIVTVCAVDENAAALLAPPMAVSLYGASWDVVVRTNTCQQDLGTGPPGHFHPRPFMVEDVCVADPADDACVACAKASCCAEYQACAGDAACVCWVGCKYTGNTDAACALPANCGPLDVTSSAAAACLDANCPAQCGTMATMSGACTCGTSSSSGTGGGATTACTPGSVLAGNSCSSDGDCESCYCNTTTMLCE